MFERSSLAAQIQNSKKPFQNIETQVDLGGCGGAWAVAAFGVCSELDYTIKKNQEVSSTVILPGHLK
jgi:hypothetical protein